VPCADGDRARAGIEAVAAHLGAAGDDLSPEQGLRVDCEGVWALVRQSATEPVLRLTVEGRSRAAADDLHGELLAVLEAATT
jgi:phosphomannomutase